MLQIGLTGNIGSGKTTVCKVFETFGIPVYYADERARLIMDWQDVIDMVVAAFEENILDSSGKLDRKTLAAIVFNSKEKLETLNGIVHPLVRNDYRQWVASHVEKPYVIQEAAIMFETGMAEGFDKVIVVAAPLDLRLVRVQQRDGVSREEVLRRAANQLPQEKLIEKADYVIHNDDRQLVIPRVLAIDHSLRSLQQF